MADTVCTDVFASGADICGPGVILPLNFTKYGRFDGVYIPKWLSVF
jgi:hypothetical protein